MSDARGRRRPARAVFFGSGAFAIPILEAVARAREVEIVGVVTAPDRAAGRGRALTAVPVAARARALGLPLVQRASLRAPDGPAVINGLEPDLGILADFGRIVSSAVLDRVPHGILNVHPSLLPRHRGASPVAAAILAGDTTTGVTVIRMDAGVDTGPIVAAESWPLGVDDITPQVEEHAATRGAALVAGLIEPWLAGEIHPQPQDDSLATHTRPFTREDGRLDPSASVIDLERRVRALQPWPGTWLDTTDGRLGVWRAAAVVADAARADEIGILGPAGLRTADGYLALHEVQPAGGRRMPFDAFLRGRPEIVGSRVARAEQHP